MSLTEYLGLLKEESDSNGCSSIAGLNGCGWLIRELPTYLLF
jgi:hypothetical protein